MQPVIQVFVFVFGAAIGSFLNAVVWRLRTHEDFVGGRSHCPVCGHVLSALDLVPIASWIGLRGRCRYCDSPISPQYLLAEVGVGILFLLAALKASGGGGMFTGPELGGLLFSWFVISVLTIAFIFDLKYMLIPAKVVVPAAVLAFAGSIALGAAPLYVLLGTVVGGGFFWLQRVLSKGAWVGGGDVYLGLLMGAALGWPDVLVALFIAYVSGAAYALGLMARKRANMKTEVPFGTFLAAATVITMLWGPLILRWYLRAL